MDRLEEVRNKLDPVLLSMADPFERRCAYIHLYGVSGIASLLAAGRGSSVELAAVSGVLHDIYAYRTGIRKFHSHNGAEDVRPILRSMNLFTPEEQKIILSAIFHHSDKKHVHDEYDELLKDADILQHFLYNTAFPVIQEEVPRLKSVLTEMKLTLDPIPSHQVKGRMEMERVMNKRTLLADIAERLAAKGIIGEAEDPDFCQIIRYWPDDDICGVLKNQWCAAFVYHCCMQAGFILPIRHPHQGSVRFAGVKAWYDWANLPETALYFRDIDGYAPQRGDIVIYDNIIEPGRKPADSLSRDHIGIVLSCNGVKITVAEGNVNNQNKSGVLVRERYKNIDGFIRINNDYTYDGWKYDYKTGMVGSSPVYS